MQGRGLNRQVIIAAAVALVVLVGAALLLSNNANLAGTAVGTDQVLGHGGSLLSLHAGPGTGGYAPILAVMPPERSGPGSGGG